MKAFLLIVTVFLVSCSTIKINDSANENYYFYFEKTDGKMRGYYNVAKQKKSYSYILDRAANILFKVKKFEDNEFKIKTIKPKDTIGLGVKNYEWLKRFDNFSRNSFFYRKPHKNFFIIEKDSLNNNLNLIEVNFVDEID